MATDFTTMSPKDLLRPTFEASALKPFVEGNMIWDGIANTVDVNAMNMSWFEDNETMITDPKRLDPVGFTSSSELPYIKISGITRKSETLKGHGMAWKYDEDIQQFPDLANEVERTRASVGNWCQWFWNNQVGSKVTNNYAVNYTSIPEWKAIFDQGDAGYSNTNGILNFEYDNADDNWANGVDRDPINDINNFVEIFETQHGLTAGGQEGQGIYRANLTDIYLPSRAFFGLQKFMSESKSTSQAWQKDPTSSGWRIPGMWDVNVHKLDYAMYQEDGTYVKDAAILVDNSQAASAVEVYQALNSKYPKVGSHWYLNGWEESKDRSLHRQILTRFVTAVRQPRGIGIIKGIAPA